jgi:hypothetical protein
MGFCICCDRETSWPWLMWRLHLAFLMLCKMLCQQQMVELSVRRSDFCPIIRFENLNIKQFHRSLKIHEVLNFLLLSCFAKSYIPVCICSLLSNKPAFVFKYSSELPGCQIHLLWSQQTLSVCFQEIENGLMPLWVALVSLFSHFDLTKEVFSLDFS